MLCFSTNLCSFLCFEIVVTSDVCPKKADSKNTDIFRQGIIHLLTNEETDNSVSTVKHTYKTPIETGSFISGSGSIDQFRTICVISFPYEE